jgi:SAM-dependent methyltransferase
VTVIARLRTVDGGSVSTPAWTQSADHVDALVLDRVAPPVLDIGCGPGRHVVALAARGVLTLGIDVTPAALALARANGAPVLERSIFARVPGARRWRTALLLDGNIGIGGDPAALLARTGELLIPGAGRVLVETAAPETRAVARTVRLEVGAGLGPWFELSVVGLDALPDVARRAGFVVDVSWNVGDRWFASLSRAQA